MKESAFSVCNPLVFLFVFHRAEVDMVSTEPRVFWGGFCIIFVASRLLMCLSVQASVFFSLCYSVKHFV